MILDDCSVDGSRRLIEEFAADYDGDCQVVLNTVNSGNVFSQWQKGLALASGELIWICESDDTCDEHFLRNIVYLFQDPSSLNSPSATSSSSTAAARSWRA